MDSGVFKAMVMVLLKNLKNLETELVAHRLVFRAVHQMGIIPDLDAALQAAKNKAAEGKDEKYEKALETFGRIADQADLEKEISEFLKSWNPEGPAN